MTYLGIILLKITLYRHARVAKIKSWIKPRQLQSAIVEYDDAAILAPVKSIKPEPADFVVCSSLRRSIDTAFLLYGAHAVQEEFFREAELPHLDFVGLKMPWHYWLILARLLWLCGYARNCESKKEFTDRAQKASDQLISLSLVHGHVVLIGHGMLNHFLARNLRAQGFTSSKPLSRQNLAATTFCRKINR